MQEKNQALAKALGKLEAFIGNWEGTGTFLEGAGPGAGTMLTVHESYAWLAGEYFLIDTSSLGFGVGSLDAHRVISYDEQEGLYVIHAYDSLGFIRTYKGTVTDSGWRFVGDFEKVTFTFSTDGNVLQTFWENSDDGKTWHPLCKTEQSKK